MSIAIWVAPFFIYLASSYYFNSKKIDVASIKFKVSTLLDTIIVYSFTMIFISQLVVTPVFVKFVLIFICLISGLIHYWNIKVQSNDFDLEIETIKNTLTVFTTTFIPFLVSIYIFSNMTIWIQYPLSIILTTLVFLISLPIKRLVVKIHDKIDYESKLVTDLTITIIYYIVIVITFGVLVIVFLNTKVSSMKYEFSYNDVYTPAFVDVDNVFDWENLIVLDIASQDYFDNLEGATEFTILVRDANNFEYVVMFTYPSESSPYMISQNVGRSLSSSLEPFDGSSKFVVDGYNFVTPSTGLYTYTSSGSIIVPGTEGYPVKIIKYGTCDTCFLVDQLDGTYKVINSLLEVIDEFTLNEPLAIINSYLFIETDNRLTRYDDTSISFTKYSGEKQYNEIDNFMFTTNRDSFGISITRESETGIDEKRFYINDKYEVIPLLNGYIYNPIKVFEDVHKETLDEDFYIYSYELDDDDWLSLAVYDSDKYLVEQTDDTTFILVTRFDSNRSYNIYSIDSFNVFNSSNVDSSDEWRVIGLMIIISILFIFIPITNYRTFTKVIDFEDAVSNKE